MSQDLFYLYTKLVQAVVQDYKDSAPAANVLMSFLPNGDWYCSIVTFKKGKKKVMHSCKAKQASAALVGLVGEYLKEKEKLTALAALQVEFINCAS